MDNRRKNVDRRDELQFKLPNDERKRERRVKERRTKERIPVKMWIRNIDGNANYFQQTGNLSVNGIYILSPNDHPKGAVIEVEFQIPGTDHVVKCHAQIMECTPDGQFVGLSARFTDMNEKDKQIISKAMDELISEFWYIIE